MHIFRAATLSLAALTAAVLLTSTASAVPMAPSAAPKNLRGFLLRPSEPVTHVFSRTPAFAWSAVRGARCYEFELATSRTFTENSIVWSNVRYGVKSGAACRPVPSSTAPAATPSGDAKSGPAQTQSDPAVTSTIAPLRVPAVSVDVALPWFTGQPYALYAHVRAVTDRGPTRWSSAFGFNMRWPDAPTPQPAQPGLVRWTPVEGATGYQVWYTDVGKVFATHTNVADQREHYTLHLDKSWYSTVHWRVRAVRRIFGDIPNGLPAVSYGPWSPVYTASNPERADGPLKVKLALSDRTSDGAKQSAHELMPAFSFTGTRGLDGRQHLFFRPYVFTDRDCVNVVFRGALIGSPAYAPRTTGPLKLPTSETELEKAATGWLKDAATEGPTRGADGMVIKTSETISGSTPTGGTAAGTGGTAGAGTSLDASQTVAGARVDLPDIDFPTTRYYWTVVGVDFLKLEDGWTYVDAEVPQDVCATGRVESFGKESAPVRTGTRTPFVAGLTPFGRLLSAATRSPQVYSTPLVAWEPARAATAYEVQWSRTRYPWRAQGAKVTYSTSAVLQLSPGTWYYRVRGLNQAQLRKPEMAWSAPVALRVARPSFKVVG